PCPLLALQDGNRVFLLVSACMENFIEEHCEQIGRLVEATLTFSKQPPPPRLHTWKQDRLWNAALRLCLFTTPAEQLDPALTCASEFISTSCSVGGVLPPAAIINIQVARFQMPLLDKEF
ncbi:unnamed protein product, partial [Pleuronectes platessa]